MNLAVYGAGGSGREVYDLLQHCPKQRQKWDEIVFIDDTKEEGNLHDSKRMPFSRLKELYTPDNTEVIIAIGEPKQRERLYNEVISSGYIFGNLIHDNSFISDYAKIGSGIVIQEGVIISSDAVINDNVYINHRCMIGHDVVIGSNCQISANVVISGGAHVGETTFIGGMSCVRDHTNIGTHCIVSMGAAVLKDVCDYSIAMGNPARVIRKNENEKVFN
ncbi:acetyltransferase [Butyrivibrio proteoclasticus B316]|uniref:Acetyltransferase n=1 Tax=Butyrivibrio proteoclasticus (strain ATCC 51982 / DSM 14932 / B316) TaxID=515622 RepID=E0RX14_BUTPB|nr:acetyltransferase [Butyrivibrio proteoclasticus]ADL34922.1 acetyltransferase [Butyrivibrio proteoclasticus B316]